MTLSVQANTDVIEDLARRTAAPVELVKDLYEDEVTKLKAAATVDSSRADILCPDVAP